MLRFGLLGAGAMGQTHAEILDQLTGAQLVAVSGGRAETAGQLAQRYGAIFYPQIEDLLNDSRVDVVDVCLPTFLHEQCVTQAALAGKHIFCEKPLALSRAEADRMAVAVQSAGVFAMVAQVVRFWPEYRLIKDMLNEGSLGRPITAYAARLHEPRPVGWLQDPIQGGGALFDLQIHDLDFLYYLFGAPQSVCAVGQQSTTGAWDHLFTTLNFGHIKAVAEASYLMPVGHPFSTEFRLVCSEGSICYRSGFPSRAEIAELVLVRPGRAPEYLNPPTTNGYMAELAYFVEKVTQGQPPEIATLGEACEVLDIAIATQLSLTRGKVVLL